MITLMIILNVDLINLYYFSLLPYVAFFLKRSSNPQKSMGLKRYFINNEKECEFEKPKLSGIQGNGRGTWT